MMKVLEAIKTRRSVRSYDLKEIPPKVMERMREALRLAPSACNFQPWRFVVVTDHKLKKALAVAAKGQNFISEAPVIVVGCGIPKDCYQHMGGDGCSIDIDLAIAFDHLSLAAAEEGLGTCWIGAFSEEEVKNVLNIPAEMKVVALMPLGYPASPDMLHPVDDARRKSPGEIFIEDKFDGGHSKPRRVV